jgi:hypothetical protein
MAKTQKDWLPRNHQELFTMVTEVTLPYLDTNRTRFGMADATPQGIWFLQKFSSVAYNPYVTAYNEWVNPETRTKVATAKFQSAEKVFREYFRELYNMLKGNPLVEDYDLEAMGFPKRSDGSRTDSPVADTPPDFAVDQLSDHRLLVEFFSSNPEHNRAKPPGQHGALIKWMISDQPVEDEKGMTESHFYTHSPAILKFAAHERGQTVYISMCWVNTVALQGPWTTTPVAAFIP